MPLLANPVSESPVARRSWSRPDIEKSAIPVPQIIPGSPAGRKSNPEVQPRSPTQKPSPEVQPRSPAISSALPVIPIMSREPATTNPHHGNVCCRQPAVSRIASVHGARQSRAGRGVRARAGASGFRDFPGLPVVKENRKVNHQSLPTNPHSRLFEPGTLHFRSNPSSPQFTGRITNSLDASRIRCIGRAIDREW